MAGIPDVLTDIRTTGQGVPMGGQPPIGGGQPPMMNQGLASMGSGQPTMPPVVDDQMSMPPMGGQEMPSEQPQEMSIEQDGVMLAEATMGRTGGDTQAAVAILDTAKAMLISGGQEEPMMMNSGGPIYAQDGTALQNWSRENLPFYEFIAEEKMPENSVTDMIKELINQDLFNSTGTRSISPLGYNMSGRALSDRDMNSLATIAAIDNSQTGRAISDRDVALHREMMSSPAPEPISEGRAVSDKDAKTFSSLLKDLQKQEVFDSLVSSRRGGIPPKIS